MKLLVELDIAPLLAQDFALFGYPVANPQRASRHSPDFTTDFWKCASDPVIQYFEQELTENQLDGIIAVKANEPIAGFQIQVSQPGNRHRGSLAGFGVGSTACSAGE